jgi:hypothetical protein
MSNTRTTAPRTRETAASRAAEARRTAPEPEEADALDEAVADAAAQQADATDGYVTVSLGGEPMLVLHAGAWRQSAMRALKNGDHDAFMEGVLHAEDYERYEGMDPTMDDIVQFIQDAQTLAGSAVGKSPGPRRPSRNTRRR